MGLLTGHRLYCCRIHAHLETVPVLPLESDYPVYEREEGVISSLGHVVPGVKSGAALPYKDISRTNELTTESFHSKPLCLAVTAVS